MANSLYTEIEALEFEAQSEPRYGDMAGELPAIEAEINQGATVEVSVPGLSFTGNGKVGLVGTVSATIPKVTGVFSTGSGITLDLPKIAGSLQGGVTHLAYMSLKLPRISVANFRATIDNTSSILAKIRALRMSAVGVAHPVGKGRVTLPALRATLDAVVGHAGDLDVKIPEFMVDLDGSNPGTPTLNVELPALTIDGYVDAGDCCECTVLEHVRGQVR